MALDRESLEKRKSHAIVSPREEALQDDSLRGGGIQGQDPERPLLGRGLDVGR